jgi:hypothetical protein
MHHKPEQRNGAVHRAGQQSNEIDNSAWIHEETCADDGTGAGVYTDHLSAVWDLKGHGFSRAESRFITMALATEGLRCSGKFNSPQGLKPNFLPIRDGTAEAVPFQSSLSLGLGALVFSSRYK